LLRDDVNRLKRLTKFVDGFADAFVRGGQSGNAHRYVRGLLSDAKRKNMAGMLRRLSDPGQCQTLQHFITHSTWSADEIWAPHAQGGAKQGRESAGVARQYCGALGKIANCQVIVTAALRSGAAVWPMAMEPFLGKEWCADEDRRERTRVPADVRHRTKIEIAIEQMDTVRAAGIEIECVLADAGYGDATDFRAAIAERGLSYPVGVVKTTTVFLGRQSRRRWNRSRPQRSRPTGDESRGATGRRASCRPNSS
jgi:SRSO17 transposase